MTDHDTIREAREALSRLDKADEEIGEVAANGRSRWRMSIPANPNRDTDLIVSDACVAGQRAITALLAVIEQQQATIERFEASNRYGDQMILAQSDVIGELNNDVSDLRATIDRQAETLRQVREVMFSLVNTLVFAARDWSTGRDLAWLWGVLCGWGDAMDEQARICGWDEQQVARLRAFHATTTRILDAGGEQ